MSKISIRFYNDREVRAIWDNIVASIGSINVAEGNSLTEQILVDDKRSKPLRQIEALERKMRPKVQPRCQREIYAEIKKLKFLI